MIRNISIGIDVGTSQTRVVVGESVKGEKHPKIIGIGESPTSGLRHGYVTDFDEASKSVRAAVSMAERASGIKIKRAYVALSSVTLRGDIATGVAVISKADGEVTSLDVNRALAECEENVNLNNRKIIQISPLSYRLDGKEVLGRLEGLRGNKLEVKALFVTCSTIHLEDLLEVIAAAGVETIDYFASSVVASHVALTEKQKIVGVALVNIGAETTSLAVYENGTLLSLHTFSIGGSDITNDIALGLKIPLETAESYKLGNISGELSKKKLDEIIEARFSDIFELIDNHLKKIKRAELLPAGVVLIGGAANTLGLEEFSRSELKLPSMIGVVEMLGNAKTKLRDPSWFVALGLLVGGKDSNTYESGSLFRIFKDLKNTVKSSVKQLMP